MDTRTVDLLALIGQDVTLVRKAGTNGGEYAGACPFCGGQDHRDPDRFRVWPAQGRYWCRRCDRQGDAIQYLRDRHNLSYPEAVERLGFKVATTVSSSSPATPSPKHDPEGPPADDWQAAATLFCQECEEALWAPAGAKALAWLCDVRGLAHETIRGASLGYNAGDRRQPASTWGLADNHTPVWLPRGVVIPWTIGGDLWRVNIRRPVGDPKYIGPAGWGNALYRADALVPGRPAVLVEGELDALTVEQYAGSVATAVATGTTSGARRTPWLSRLALCSKVLVAFDSDEAGEKASQYWLDVLGDTAVRWRAYYGKDANGLATAGGDLEAWVRAAFSNEAPAHVDITST